eukprot:TRINITY_DN60998_c0_g1_i1.p1 TRINITY_DN60998_c0_g1~~TRINITY_DN60998_c0_g1_i1.p1  ORF type:complete len:311 (-),score=77.38 TRINITY_DN60998_c0_g1_i1:433-1365(-)
MAIGGLKRFDLYARVPVDLTNPTNTGSVISIFAAVIMLYLFVSELVNVMQPETTVDMVVEPDSGQKLNVNFNISFPHFPCFVFSLDVVDAMGRHEVGVSSSIVKTRLSAEGLAVGEYTSQPSDAELSGMREEGCNVVGYVAVNKVPGNFHISAHSSVQLVQYYLNSRINLQHVVHSLWIGDRYLTPKEFPGHLHPLDGTVHVTEAAASTYEYFLDIVPTKYVRYGTDHKGYQIVAHRNSFSAGHQMPALFFRYTLSPVQVVHVTKRKSLAHFVTYLCAIVGGVFTVAGIVNSMVQQSARIVQKTLLGKVE